MGVLTSAKGQAFARARDGIALRIRWDVLAARSAEHSPGGVSAATWSVFAMLGVATLAALGLTAAGVDSIVPAQARSAPAPSEAAAEASPEAALPSVPAAYLTLSGTPGRGSLAFSLSQTQLQDRLVFSLSQTPREKGFLLVLPGTADRAGAHFALPETPRRDGPVFALPETPSQDGPVFALPETSPREDTPAPVAARESVPNPSPPVDGPAAAWREARALPDRPVAAASRARPAATLPATPPAREAEPVTPVLKPVAVAYAAPADAPPPVVHKPRTSVAPAAPASVASPSEGRPAPTIATVMARFDSLDYDLAAVRSTATPVPRVYLDTLPDDLAAISSTDAKKRLFVQAVLPIILRINEEIVASRWRLKRLEEKIMWPGTVTPADREWLVATAERYGTVPFDIPSLLSRMDAVPPSLALAQGAEESGWGTSRFAQEGNALFGLYTYDSVSGMVPERRDADSRHRVRSYITLLEAVGAYVHNLNTHPAYEDFRDRRASLRRADRPLGGHDLAGQLQSYSERREAYVETIRQLIRQNRLGDFDRAWLNNRQWTAVVGLPSGRPI